MSNRIESPGSHEIYARRGARNRAVLVVLLALAAMVFAVTLVKVGNGGHVVGFDHTLETTPPVTE
ncbi:hypothetical protein [Halovulum sp. GXIMD14793]